MTDFSSLRSLLCGALLVACTGSTHALTVSPDDPNLRYNGRWNFDNPQAPWVGWQGSSIEVKFIGTSIDVDLDVGSTNDFYRVIVDGVPNDGILNLPAGRNTYTLASGLAAGVPHTVSLYKETYYTIWGTGKGRTTQFYGFEIPGGSLQSLPPRPALRIEFFGDSNMDGTSLYSEKDQQGNDPLSPESGTYYAFPAMASRMLGAEYHIAAVGGAIIAGATDNAVASFIYSQNYYDQNYSYRSGFNPHVVVINAGANDIYSVKGKDPKQKIKDRYKQVIGDIRNVYGNQVHIVLHNAYGFDVNEPSGYTQEVVDEVGGNLSALHYPWMWEQWHGSMIEHAGQARLLAQHIASLGIGFTIQQDAEIFDGFGRNFNVANGSFEGVGTTGFKAFGWRYVDDGVERVCGAGASDGNCFIRLEQGEKVHQGTDATGDFAANATSGNQRYTVKAMIRSSNGGTAVIGADFEGQALYNRSAMTKRSFAVDGQWREYTATFTAPNGTWKTYITLQSDNGVVEFDNVRMTGN